MSDESTPGPWRRTSRRLFRDKPAMLALVFLVLLMVAAVFAPVVATHDPAEQFVDEPFARASGDAWLGTDDLGRDTFSRLVFGARVSLRTGMQVLVLALVVAVPVGLLAGYRGGRVDQLVMRIMDAFGAFPALILALAVVSMLGPGLEKVAVALGIVMIPGFVRIVRAQTLAVRQETFVEASESIGTPEMAILRRRVLPNVASPLIVAVALAAGGVLIAEAGLSLLGFGVQPPEASWGAMLQRGYGVVFAHPWQVLVPGFVLAATVLAFNTLGDGLRDAMGLGLPKITGVRGRIGITSVLEPPAPVSEPASKDCLLSVSDLTVEFHTESGPVTVVEEIGFDVRPGEVLGIVGESGSGKSVTSLAVMRLIPTPPGRIVRGSVEFEGRELLSLPLKEMRDVRGSGISMIFQDPMTSLNPAFTIGNMLVEVIRRGGSMSKDAARRRGEELLDLVEIPEPGRRMKDYPHQLSGGMRQRALIAIALAREPRLLIADEPTTALDVTVQAQILDLLRSLQQQLDMAIMFITHDLSVVADLCDRVIVMYAGRVVEENDVHSLFAAPRHPYTEGLLGAIPQAGSDGALRAIPGVVPSPGAMPKGCRFEPRCPYRRDDCVESYDGGPIVGRSRCLHEDVLTLRGVE